MQVYKILTTEFLIVHRSICHLFYALLLFFFSRQSKYGENLAYLPKSSPAALPVKVKSRKKFHFRQKQRSQKSVKIFSPNTESTGLILKPYNKNCSLLTDWFPLNFFFLSVFTADLAYL